jgi:hypothetical protein
MLEDGNWIYPNSEDTLQSASLLTMEEYIEQRRKTIKYYVHSTNIYNKCIHSKASPRNTAQIVWWNEEESLENE